MGCNCGQFRLSPEILTAMTASGTGSYPLASYPGCTTMYDPAGRYAGSSVFVVGRLTDVEKLFPRNQLAEASKYARDNGQQIENVPTTAICAQAVEAVMAIPGAWV